MKIMWMLNSKMLSRRGFSLIELVVVLTILSVLSTVSIISYRGYRERALKQLDMKQLSSFVVMADVFKATNQFYLPNMQAMNISLEGQYYSRYEIICHKDELTGDILFRSYSGAGDQKTSEGEYCGKVDLKVVSVGTEQPLDVKDQCNTSTSARGWAGYVFCHYYAQENPEEWGNGDQWLPPSGKVFPNNNNVSPYAGKGYDNLGQPYTQSGFQLEDRDSSNWNAIIQDEASKYNAFYKYFYIYDVSVECPRASYATGDACFQSIKYSPPVNLTQPILEALPGWSTEKDHFISSPNKLVFIALACKKTGLKKCERGEEYRVIRMDTNRLLKVYYGF